MFCRESDRKSRTKRGKGGGEEKNRLRFGTFFGEPGDRQETSFSFGEYPLLSLQQNLTVIHGVSPQKD